MSSLKEECGKCGAKASLDYNFCLSCGTKLQRVRRKGQVAIDKQKKIQNMIMAPVFIILAIFVIFLIAFIIANPWFLFALFGGVP